ncbi:MAG: hypothetical protein ABS916_09310 [Carnobacterium sp.]|uniref:hypothetical protein n=1 Tax=Carnobacterium sp. TaxID=48221 RepID=UPI00331495C5
MENIIDESGKIKKGEIIERALASAPVLDKEIIAEKILDYVKNAKNSKYFILNSRKINYTQVFVKTETADAKKVTDHILDFLEESTFVTCSEDSVLVATNELVEHKMIDIKDIDEEKDGLGLYIDGIYFKFYSAGWQVEEI